MQSPYQDRYNNREIFSSSSHQTDLVRIIDIKYIHRVFLLSSTFEISWRTDGSSWQRLLFLVAYLLRSLEIIWCLFTTLYYLLGILFLIFSLTCPSPRSDIFFYPFHKLINYLRAITRNAFDLILIPNLIVIIYILETFDELGDIDFFEVESIRRVWQGYH